MILAVPYCENTSSSWERTLSIPNPSLQRGLYRSSKHVLSHSQQQPNKSLRRPPNKHVWALSNVGDVPRDKSLGSPTNAWTKNVWTGVGERKNVSPTLATSRQSKQVFPTSDSRDVRLSRRPDKPNKSLATSDSRDVQTTTAFQRRDRQQINRSTRDVDLLSLLPVTILTPRPRLSGVDISR